MTKDQALAIVGILNGAYPTNKMDDAAALVFARFIMDLDYECCRHAIKEWIRNEKWFPSIAEVTEATRSEMRRVMPPNVTELTTGGRTLTREENQARLREIQAQMKEAKGPLFNPRARQAGLGSEAPPDRRSPR